MPGIDCFWRSESANFLHTRCTRRAKIARPTTTANRCGPLTNRRKDVRFMATEHLSAQRVRELFSYDPETGALVSTRKMCRRKLGEPVGVLNSWGYLVVKVDSKQYRVHRLIWLYVTGDWPTHQIDHINGVKTDNRWCNLRDATPAENQRNKTALQSNNTSGRPGVSLVRKSGRYRAVVHVDGKGVYLGSFANADDAHAAYIDGKRRMHATRL